MPSRKNIKKILATTDPRPRNSNQPLFAHVSHKKAGMTMNDTTRYMINVVNWVSICDFSRSSNLLDNKCLAVL